MTSGGADARRSFVRTWLIAAGVFVLTGFLIYWNALGASFRFDDWIFIADRMQVRDLGRIWRDGDIFRRIPYLTFALNYRWTGLDVWSWHLVNVGLHVLVSLTVAAIAGILWNFRVNANHPLREKSRWMSLASGLIFLCHPLATSAVTYVYQRIIVIAVLFHLLTLCFYLYARLARRPVWYLPAAIFAVLACFSKQINLTLPLTLLLCEICFGSKSLKDFVRRNWVILPALFGLVLFYAHIFKVNVFKLDLKMLRELYPANINSGLSWAEWIPTQINVSRTYLRMFVFPINQTIDHDYPIASSFLEPGVLLSLAIWAALFAAAFICWRGQRIISFGILLAAAALTIEFAAIRDVIFEHRAYLPLTGFALALPQIAGYLIRDWKRCRFVLIAMIAALAIATVARNAVWADEELFWREGIRLAPNKGRPYYSLGVYYARRGEHAKALPLYQKAIEIWPNYADAISNYGKSLEHVGRMPEAIRFYRRALDIDPTLPEALNNYGSALVREGRYEEARAAYAEAIRRKPDNYETLNNMGSSFAQQKKYDEAMGWYLKSIKANPLYAEAHNNIGSIYSIRGFYPEAEKFYKEALRLRPEFFEAWNNLATMYVWQKRREDAAGAYRRALEIYPGFAEGNNNIASLLASSGKSAEAAEYYRRAIGARPQYVEAWVNYATLLAKEGRPNEAVQLLAEAERANPENREIRAKKLAYEKNVGF